MHIFLAQNMYFSRFGMALMFSEDISDRHVFDFQLVASDYTDCPLRYTRLSSILSQKAGHSTCHLQVHQKLMLAFAEPLGVGIRVSCHISSLTTNVIFPWP